MNDHEAAAAALQQVVPLGPTVAQAELGAAVSRHVSGREPRRLPEPAIGAALRTLAANPPPMAADEPKDSPLVIHVDVAALLAAHGDDAWAILSRLKELFA